LKKFVFVTLIALTLLLSACGRRQTESAEAPVEEQPGADVPAENSGDPAPAENPEVIEPAIITPAEFVRDRLLESGQVGSPDLVAATMFLMQAIPVGAVDSYIFSYEDAVGSVSVKCTIHTIMRTISDTYEITTAPAVECVPAQFADPISIFKSFGVDENSSPTDVIFGQVYTAEVVAIRVLFEDGEANALIAGGGYQVNLPSGATGVTITAYDESGGVVFNGTPVE